MKKLFVLTLALAMVVCMFAACGGDTKQTNAPETNPPATNPPTTDPVVTDPGVTESDPTDPGEKVVVASALSNHENGWEVEAWNEGTSGVYFNLWSNDLPYNSDWSVEYWPTSQVVAKLIRDGEVYEYANPAHALLVKFSGNSYYLKFDKFMVPDLFPLQEGDVIILEGDFANLENGWTIHFDKTYVQLKVGGITKFTTTAPEGITE